MVNSIFATKIGMMQAWTKQGKRLAVTRCQVAPNLVLSHTKNNQPEDRTLIEVGYGKKKIKNMSKPLRTQLEKGGFSVGVRTITGVSVSPDAAPAVGTTFAAQDVLTVGDVVMVQGTSKGHGFAGAVKRHGFAGGPKTHGQSDRERAVGSIGAGTTPGRVFKGKRMPGHYGVETVTVRNLVVLRINPETQEVWLSGPVPGSLTSTVKISKTGKTKAVELYEISAPVAAVETTDAQVENTEVVTEA